MVLLLLINTIQEANNIMSTQIKTQVLVLGAGPGGYSAAFRCADLGMDTTIIERYPNLGGVCLNVGCIPSKALLYISKLIKDSKNLINYGISTKLDNFNVDINKINLWKNNIINRLSRNLSSMAKTRGVKIINGSGKFINDHTVIILTNQETTLEITFNHVIIATGSYPVSLSFAPKDHRIWNSTDALLLKIIPNQLLIIGSGSIGLEMATVYSAMGSKVDLVEIYDQIMPVLDEDIIQIFTKNISKNTNINFITNTQVNTIHTKQDGIYVCMQNKTSLNKQYTNRYDVILVAIGRAPNSNTLNLDHLKINVDNNGFIIVDKQMRTNISHIFAIGDIVGHPMLAHKSIYEGRIAAEVICGKKYYFDAKIIPSVIYSDPEIAWTGYTEKEAKTNNINYESVTLPWTALGKAVASDCTEGITKLIFDKNTHRIIGGSVTGSHASEIIGEIALAIEMGCDVEDITLTIHAHPTLYESINLAASKYTTSNIDLTNIKI